MMNQFKFYRLDGKSVTMFGDEGWTIAGQAVDDTLAQLVRDVPWLYRAVDLIGSKAASMPFAIVDKAGNDYDSSATWENKIGFMPQPRRLIDQVARSLTVYGCAYALAVRNRARVLSLRYMAPRTITPALNERTGLTGFKRQLGGTTIEYPAEEMIHFWPASEQVELGPPPDSPVRAAANAAGVLRGADLFASGYMERGGVRVTILAVPEGTQDAEKKRLQSWWRNIVMGVKSAFAAHVINADSVKPTVIGDGLEGLQNAALTTSKREDIATALGIPQTLLFSNAANYATAQQDALNFYTMTIVPLCEFIAETLNEQLFSAYGLRMEPRPETIDAFHEDEKEMAAAYSTYVGAGMKPSVAAQIVGIELPGGMEYDELDEEDPEPAPAPAPAIQPQAAPEIEPEMPEDLKKWQRKALNAFERGKSPAVEFITTQIDEVTKAAIFARLEKATNRDEIMAAFDEPEPESPLVLELKRANELLAEVMSV